jgi:hypothetical protein
MNNETIEKNVLSYAILKEQSEALKKQLDVLNKIIKETLLNSDDTIYEREGFDYKATVTKVSNDKLNDDKLIACLKTMKELGNITPQKFNKIVRTREYIDQEALEDAMYNGYVPATTVGECIDHKEPTYRLTVKGVTNNGT